MAKNVNRRNLLHQPFEVQVEVLRNLKGGQTAIVASMSSDCIHTGTFSEYVRRIASEIGVPIGDAPTTPYYRKVQYFPQANQNQLIIGRRASLPPRT